MRINNSVDTFSLENVSVKVIFTDADGKPVVATSNTAASNAAFFIRVDDTRDVSGLQTGADGFVQHGSIAPKKSVNCAVLSFQQQMPQAKLKTASYFLLGLSLNILTAVKKRL